MQPLDALSTIDNLASARHRPLPSTVDDASVRHPRQTRDALSRSSRQYWE
jgi:hypothetical protein